MAAEMRPTTSQLSSRNPDTTYRKKPLDFKAAGQVVTATTGSRVAPRQYIKTLHTVITTLEKYRAKLSPELLKALKDLDDLVNEAARSYSSAATGKVYYYLMEDYQLRKLRPAAAALHSEVSNLARLSTYSAQELRVDTADCVSKLSSGRCSLQPSQMQLIEEFKAVASTIDPSADISDAAQKITEQVVRKVIAEVHGPFFNEEILEKEVSHLEKAAAHVDPETNRYEAASIKLLASTLMNLDGDEPADEDDDSVTPGSVDPYSVPSFAPVTIRVVEPTLAAVKGGTGLTADGSPTRRLTIQMTDDGSSSPVSSLQQQLPEILQQQFPGTIAAVYPASGNSPRAPLSPLVTPRPAAAAEQGSIGPGSPVGSRLDQTAARAAAAAVAGMGKSGDALVGPEPAANGSGSQQQQQQQQLSNGELRSGSTSSVVRGTSQKLLDDFIDSNVAQGSRDKKACMFHAEMRLPREGVEKLAAFLESSGRVRGLSLAHNWIGPQGMQRLCAAMAVNRSVKTLDLPDNKLGDAGAVCIAQLLTSGSNVTSLQLSHNEIGDEGMLALAEAISQTRTLEKLSIYSNNITSVGCTALTAAVTANPNLKVVEFLPGNAAHTRDVKALARAVKQNRKFKIFHLFGKQCAG